MENNNYLILARIGEIALKGLNRHRFVERVVKNISWRLENYGNYKVYSSQSRIWVEPLDEAAAEEAALEEVLSVVCRVFGIVSASIVLKMQGDFTDICRKSLELVKEKLGKDEKCQTFKVECKRARKSFPLTSPEIQLELGAYLLESESRLKVDVHHPDFVVWVEIREEIYLYTTIVPGIKGLPVGMGGKGLLLLSGGIDSPVAGYMMASRGMELEAVYFHSYPFTSDEAKEKVIDLARIVSEYSGRIRLHIVNFTDIQVTLRQNCPEDMLTLVMRRIMFRIAEEIARQQGCQALITGESLGQVASQTIDAIDLTNQGIDMPIFRPLIGMDKDATTEIARKIGTFETSILPYEDCCTIFVAKHPKTKPSRKDGFEAEKSLNIQDLVQQGVNEREILIVSQKRHQ